MKSSNDSERAGDETPDSLGDPGSDADSLDGSGFTDEMQDGEGEDDDRIGAHTDPSRDGGSGDR
jgi:hypothetical protein